MDVTEEVVAWLALHRATNPDPVAAVAEALDAARFAARPHAAELVAEARERAGC